ncbi:recombinase family protein, partial [Acidiphilium sp. JA12-A1]|uniref:recombinase family protein n=1 Tax=Acidiphilium sp. JA12-A1 TaxID=1464546 RepID=UPI000460EBBD
MSRAFLYARVSTVEQTAENQIAEAKAAGFAIRPNRIITETISGSVAARQRPEFRRLLDRLEDGDVLVVTKLDRLGRSALDVRATVDALASLGVRLHCLALGGVDLTSWTPALTL